MSDFAQNSSFQIGWEDRPDFDKKAHPCLHCKFTKEDLKNSGILPSLNEIYPKSKFAASLNPSSYIQSVLNVSKPGDIYYAPTHLNQIALVYYINMDWKEEWYGETIFWDKNHKDIIYTSAYTPGRVIIFDGNYPHSIRPQSIVGPNYRFSLSLFYRKKA